MTPKRFTRKHHVETACALDEKASILEPYKSRSATNTIWNTNQVLGIKPHATPTTAVEQRIFIIQASGNWNIDIEWLMNGMDSPSTIDCHLINICEQSIGNLWVEEPFHQLVL